jgi:hypothetical protein
MDPLTLGMTLAGLGTSIFGTISGMGAANQSSALAQQNAGLEMQVNSQRKQAMEVDARRRQLDVVRNNQRARSMAQTTATSEGAQFGSGLQGAYGQISGQAGFNLQGINQNLAIGRNIFGLDTQISQNKIQMAGLEGQQATDQGIGQLGGDLMRSAGPFSSLFKQLQNPLAL